MICVQHILSSMRKAIYGKAAFVYIRCKNWGKGGEKPPASCDFPKRFTCKYLRPKEVD
ncbi:hypothetical protein cypCar_00022388, partial [Cyprinus carpio]